MEAKSAALSSVLRFKDLYNPYLYVGTLGRIVGAQSRSGERGLSTRLIDNIVGRTALRGVSMNSDDYNLYRRAEYWHGTGRYQYVDKQVVDVLTSIARTGMLMPNYDAFDLTRPMRTISLAYSRVYGRTYADMHGRGINEKERYGSSLFWACAFLGDIAVEASIETQIWRCKGYRRMMHHLVEADAIRWYKKLTSTSNNTVVDIYKNGSDIPDNYPILFGIKSAGIACVTTSRAVGIHEARTEQSLSIEKSVTHVEVPRARVKEVAKIMGGMAVRAIEDGERWSANYPFSSHMAGKI